MSERTERVAAVRQLVAQLDAIASQPALAAQWPDRRRPPTWYTGRFVQRLLAHLVSADHELALEEFYLVHDFQGDDLDYAEEIAWLRDVAAQHPEFPWMVPTFFVAAIRSDAQAQTQFADQLIDTIEAICRTVISADGVVLPDEVFAVDDLLATLRRAWRDERARSGAAPPT